MTCIRCIHVGLMNALNLRACRSSQKSATSMQHCSISSPISAQQIQAGGHAQSCWGSQPTAASTTRLRALGARQHGRGESLVVTVVMPLAMHAATADTCNPDASAMYPVRDPAQDSHRRVGQQSYTEEEWRTLCLGLHKGFYQNAQKQTKANTNKAALLL